ncbi:hypothetical protein PTKIN_Ptkin12aG0061600 [Pterospermum kingtungense]
MLASTNLICCNFSYSSQNSSSKFTTLIQATNRTQQSLSLSRRTSKLSVFLKPQNQKTLTFLFQQKGVLQICQSTINTHNSEEEAGGQVKVLLLLMMAKREGIGQPPFCFLCCGVVSCTMFSISHLTRHHFFKAFLAVQIRFLFAIFSRDMYFLKKLLYLKGGDGFRMNDVLVALWHMMGLWPLVYSMLLLPTGRSSKNGVPAWPFLVLSCFLGAYALLPYFVLWSPPPPPVEEDELKRWPLNFLESKLTAVISLAAGIGLIIYAGLANADVWREFYQYLGESKLIHITCLDFTLLSAFAPFWVYNDMTARKWYDKGFWLLPLSLVPFLGPALYLVLRPSLSDLPVTSEQN